MLFRSSLTLTYPTPPPPPLPLLSFSSSLLLSLSHSLPIFAYKYILKWPLPSTNTDPRLRAMRQSVQFQSKKMSRYFAKAFHPQQSLMKSSSSRSEADITLIALLLAASPVLHLAPQNVLSDLARIVTCHLYGPGQCIVREKEKSEEYVIILAGTVKVVNHTADGVEKEINRLGPGEAFGELGILLKKPRSSTVSTPILFFFPIVFPPRVASSPSSPSPHALDPSSLQFQTMREHASTQTHWPTECIGAPLHAHEYFLHLSHPRSASLAARRGFSISDTSRTTAVHRLQQGRGSLRRRLRAGLQPYLERISHHD